VTLAREFNFTFNFIFIQAPMQPEPRIRKISLIGSYVPRQCGIATFTKSLRDSLARSRTKEEVDVVALVDENNTYKFPAEVGFKISQQSREDYFRAAEYLSKSDCDVVCVQHEYGIFGGPAGEYLLDLLNNLTKPIFATFHTVLENPNPDQRRVLTKISQLSTKVVVMSERAVNMLHTIYGIPKEKISMIHHGVPDAFDSQPGFLQRGNSVQNLLTFGLLSPDKGIEHVIRALPRIIEEQDNVHYYVVGATHPHIKAHSGESYRDSLVDLAENMGVANHVTFVNRFVSSCELVEILDRADIYITPYLKLEQITSGTLAYAVGSGKAVISTPYWYAEELLAEDRGVLVPWKDSNAIADAAIRLLTDSGWRDKVTRNARLLGKEMSWSAIGRQYFDLFHSEPAVKPVEQLRLSLQMAPNPRGVPPLNLNHLVALTDDTGLIQHAIYSTPRYMEGYCLDDNCRALLLTAMAKENSVLTKLAGRYLAFVAYALDPESGKFRNFMSYSRQWLETIGSEDSQARALWCLGGFAARTQNQSQAACAIELFKKAVPAWQDWTSPRAWAYALIGIGELHGNSSFEDGFYKYAEDLALRLLSAVKNASQPGWSWYESYLTYCNAVLPHALFVSSRVTGNKHLIAPAVDTLEWLWQIQLNEDGLFEPVGSTRAFIRGDQKPRFDQQPVEVSTMISACIEAWNVTRDPKWKDRAWTCFAWFKGANWLGKSLIDAETGGCFDGLQREALNQNQGAESTVSLLLSCTELKAFERVANNVIEFRQVV
jgi:glycosyltransferase involved in cell wall biosynthesis